jgi:hypothetical protein
VPLISGSEFQTHAPAKQPLRRGRQFLALWLLLTLAAGAGRSAEPASAGRVIPAPAAAVGKEHVYIFLINGVDLLHYGDLPGLGDRLAAQGFVHTRYGELSDTGEFHDQIYRIHQSDRLARFVLIGFSLGANRACELAESLRGDGVRFDLVVFLSGNHWLGGLPRQRPANVRRVVNILAGGALSRQGQRDWAENYQLPSAWHFGTPSHPATLQFITFLLCGNEYGR